MGSLRNPVGPLPSSIYWRRRAVALTLVALLALLVAWVVTSGGGGGGSDQGKGGSGSEPVSSITPGPSSSESLISQRPGGRDETDDGSTGGDGGTEGSGEGDSGGDGDAGGDGADDAGSDGADDADDAGGDGTDGGSAGGPGGAEAVPAGSPLPDCRPGPAEVKLDSVEKEYAPGEKPAFLLTVRNTGDSACKVDFGAGATVLSVTRTGGDDTVWQSDHCPAADGSAFYRVPADGEATRTLKWNRGRSAPGCATPDGGAAAAGNYLAEAEVEGVGTASAPFVLTKD